MKHMIVALLLCASARAQMGGNFYGSSGGSLAYEPNPQAAYERQLAANAARFVPRDPWREIDGGTNYAKGPDWVEFSGEVIDVQPTGILIDGDYGAPFCGYYEYSGLFFVNRFPYEVADNEGVRDYSAKTDGVYSYINTQGGTSTVRKLDYGIISQAPPDLVAQAEAEQNERQREQSEAAERKRERAEISAVKWLMPQATNGDAGAQCDLGEHYLRGEGVSTNIEQAIYWLRLSASQGDAEASKVLATVRR